MFKVKKILGIVCLACISALLFHSTASAVIKIGVLAKRGVPKSMRKWGPTASYLTSQLGEKAIIVPLKFDAIEQSVVTGRIDFLLANSAFHVEMEKKHNAKAIATLINSRRGKALRTFGGVILVKKGSPIKTLDDLKGKKFMCVKYSSFGGAHMAWKLLLDNGIDPEKDFSSFIQGGKHDTVVMAVKNGEVDAGTVRSDTLERMAGEGKIKMSDFRIINKINDNFPFVHSTELYPEWPLAALPKIDAATSDKVKNALLKIKSNSRAAKAAKVIGWTEPADYTSVRDCLTTIKYGAFAD